MIYENIKEVQQIIFFGFLEVKNYLIVIKLPLE